MTVQRWLAVGLLVGATSHWVGPARADAADKALAESLFREGRESFERGQLATACEKFAESHRLDPAIGTLLNLAECHAQTGKTASAWAEFRETAELARQAGQRDRAGYATRRAAELEKRLSFARLVLPTSSEITGVELDGRTLGRAAWRSRLPLDPGPHDLVVRIGDGVVHKRFELPARPGEHEVEVREAERRPAALAGASERGRSAEPSGDVRPVLGVIGLGVGAVGLGVGSYFAVRASSLKSDSDAHCEGSRCDQRGLDAYADAKRAADVATVSFVVGAVAAAAGGGILIWYSADEHGIGQFGVRGRF